jgi:hypothetical protein
MLAFFCSGDAPDHLYQDTLILFRYVIIQLLALNRES